MISRNLPNVFARRWSRSRKAPSITLLVLTLCLGLSMTRPFVHADLAEDLLRKVRMLSAIVNYCKRHFIVDTRSIMASSFNRWSFPMGCVLTCSGRSPTETLMLISSLQVALFEVTRGGKQYAIYGDGVFPTVGNLISKHVGNTDRADR